MRKYGKACFVAEDILNHINEYGEKGASFNTKLREALCLPKIRILHSRAPDELKMPQNQSYDVSELAVGESKIFFWEDLKYPHELTRSVKNYSSKIQRKFIIEQLLTGRKVSRTT